MDITVNTHTSVNIIVAFLWSFLLKTHGRKLQDGFRVWLPDKPKLSWRINAVYCYAEVLCWPQLCPEAPTARLLSLMRCQRLLFSGKYFIRGLQT